MSRKNKNKSNLEVLFEGIIYIAYYLILFIVFLIYKIITFMYDLVTYIKTEYKKKSGNSFFKCLYDKGVIGEFKLYRMMVKIFGKDNVLTNLYLPSTKIDTTEIDVLAVSNNSIYCFEVKNYSGFIYGSEEDKYWTQVLNRRNKYKFYNPVKQNLAHELAIKSFINIENDNFVPVVVFSNRSKLKKLNVKSTILQMNSIKKYVKKIDESNSNFVIKNKEDIINKLSSCSLASDKIKKEHISQIEKEYYFKDLDN